MDKYKRFLRFFLAGYVILVVVAVGVYKLYLSEYIEKGRWKTFQERFCGYASFNKDLCEKLGCVGFGSGIIMDSQTDGNGFFCLPPTWND